MRFCKGFKCFILVLLIGVSVTAEAAGQWAELLAVDKYDHSVILWKDRQELVQAMAEEVIIMQNTRISSLERLDNYYLLPVDVYMEYNAAGQITKMQGIYGSLTGTIISITPETIAICLNDGTSVQQIPLAVPVEILRNGQYADMDAFKNGDDILLYFNHRYEVKYAEAYGSI